MNKLSLNFFGEQVEVNLPESLASLRNKISEMFLLSPSDTAELVISYVKNFGKKIIETENDFKDFASSKICKIDLDIDKNSQLFKKSLINIQTEKETDNKELEKLLSKLQELKTEKNLIQSESEKKMNELTKKREDVERQKKEVTMRFDYEIKKIKGEITQISKNAKKEEQIIDKKEKELLRRIDEIKSKNGMSVEKKEEEEKLKSHKQKSKKEEKKPVLNKTLNNIVTKINNYIKTEVEKTEKEEDLKEDEKNLLNSIKKWSDYVKTNTEQITDNISKKYNEYKMIFNPDKQKEVHWGYICDGCNAAPIKGIRYHCEECKDFDFCEKCHTEKKDSHAHNFKAIEKTVIEPPVRKFRAPRFVSDKNIHKGVTCDGCGAFPIMGCRYKCAICKDFDFCENCEKKLAKEHSHPMVQISSPKIKIHSIICKLKKEYKMNNEQELKDIIHDGIICDGCNTENIVGPRYKCTVCPNFDYCEKCMKEHSLDHVHPFIKIYHPKMVLSSIKVVVDEKCPTYSPPTNNTPNEYNKKSEKLRGKNYRNILVERDLPIHDKVICDGCEMNPIVGCRYKCAICRDFDYCEKCENKHYKEHSHPMIRITSPEMNLPFIKCKLKEQFNMKDEKENSKIVHDDITCDGCGCENIVGNRYKCAVCQNFDYCEKCINKYSSEHKHPFIKIYHPKMKLDSIKVFVNENCPVYNNSNSNSNQKLRGGKPKKEEKKEEKKEKEIEKMSEKNDKPIHNGISCNGCGIKSIIGCRYKCAVCQNFDFCEKCEEKYSEKHEHPFIKIYYPEMKIASIRCIVRDDCPDYQNK